MANLLLVTIPAVIAAVGSIITAYVASKVRTIASQTNGRMRHLENELRLVRRLLDEANRS